MISLCHSKCTVVQLKEEGGIEKDYMQRGIRGHVIVYPQRPSEIARSLPPSVEEITSPLCVLFVGAYKPSDEWLRTKAKPLAVNGAHVWAALKWLKNNNPLYRDIEINETVLQELDDNPNLPFVIQHILPSAAGDTLTLRYEASVDNPKVQLPVPDSVNFESIIIADVDFSSSSNNLKQATMRHIHKRGGGYIELTHDPSPTDKFNNPLLFPMIYPTLFLYGVGGFEEPSRRMSLLLCSQVKHFFNLNDTRFQEHYSFLFSAFNMLQRREMLLHTSLKVKRKSFTSVARSFATVSPEALHMSRSASLEVIIQRQITQKRRRR
ncbi:uncharacterized protein EV420DRAFT_1280878 [Desarmillaria tabescens]|uniref:DUF6570 domain-containing protein n=1 Tax=Armillaria tabescens TaxID=1929756 RepID=A0AA39JAF9_ARMTA|nr:uncharacterized protein EV420DRAFT_1280878 [Desarmillaria tabescens]KAK0437113.1 hypothetical protein EV420DRAFT_1280878 [Desarmillaria tabescens]